MRTLSIILTLMAFTASFAYALNEPEDSLILYFSFDESTEKTLSTIHSMRIMAKWWVPQNMSKVNSARHWNSTERATGSSSHTKKSSPLTKALPSWLGSTPNAIKVRMDNAGKASLQRATIRVLIVSTPNFRVNVCTSVSVAEAFVTKRSR